MALVVGTLDTSYRMSRLRTISGRSDAIVAPCSMESERPTVQFLWGVAWKPDRAVAVNRRTARHDARRRTRRTTALGRRSGTDVLEGGQAHEERVGQGRIVHLAPVDERVVSGLTMFGASICVNCRMRCRAGCRRVNSRVGLRAARRRFCGGDLAKAPVRQGEAESRSPLEPT